MTQCTEDEIRQILSSVNVADTGYSCANALQTLSLDSSRLVIQLEFPFPVQPVMLERQLLDSFPEHLQLNMELSIKIAPHAVQGELKTIPGIKNIIGVASGKGGVGKSTTSVNLALALATMGAKVGLLDADIYGPNQPHMLGVTQKPAMTEDKKLVPLEAYGVKSMSMGYLVAKEAPMVWRGPMVSSALNQLLNDTQWGELDYLIVDLPPGTGDIQLTLAKKVPVSGVVIVTTPQDVALLDAQKALAMFDKMSVPVLGIVENMATHICSECGHEEPIFGQAGGQRMAAAAKLPLLGQLPLALKIREACDAGRPIVAADQAGEASVAYYKMAINVAATLSERPKGYSHLFSNIVVEKD